VGAWSHLEPPAAGAAPNLDLRLGFGEPERDLERAPPALGEGDRERALGMSGTGAGASGATSSTGSTGSAMLLL
jgi:hypothetical protein